MQHANLLLSRIGRELVNLAGTAETRFLIQADGRPVGRIYPQADAAGSVALGPRQHGADQFRADVVTAAVGDNPQLNQLGICPTVSRPEAAREADPAASIIRGDHDGQGVAVFGTLRSFHPLRRSK